MKERRIKLDDEDWAMVDKIRGIMGLNISQTMRACIREAYPPMVDKYAQEYHRLKATTDRFEPTGEGAE